MWKYTCRRSPRLAEKGKKEGVKGRRRKRRREGERAILAFPAAIRSALEKKKEKGKKGEAKEGRGGSKRSSFTVQGRKRKEREEKGGLEEEKEKKMEVPIFSLYPNNTAKKGRREGRRREWDARKKRGKKKGQDGSLRSASSPRKGKGGGGRGITREERATDSPSRCSRSSSGGKREGGVRKKRGKESFPFPLTQSERERKNEEREGRRKGVPCC